MHRDRAHTPRAATPVVACPRPWPAAAVAKLFREAGEACTVSRDAIECRRAGTIPHTVRDTIHQTMSDPRRGEKMRTGAPTRVTTWVLAAVVVIQLALLGWSQWPGALRVAQYQGLPATERSARIAFGDQFGDFIQFLSAEIPPNGRLVVPPMDMESILGDIGLMQYFLFPRQIVNCPSGDDMPACVQSMTGSNTHILRTGKFPPSDAVPPAKDYQPFSADWGIYSPR